MGIYKKMDLKGSGVQEEERVKRGDKGRKAPSGLMVPVVHSNKERQAPQVTSKGKRRRGSQAPMLLPQARINDTSP